MTTRSYAEKIADRFAKKRRQRSRLDSVTRSLNAKRSAETKRKIADSIALERARQEAVVLELARSHRVSVSDMRQRVLGASNFKRGRKVNKFNAWVHCRSLDVNENLAEGDRKTLLELHNQALAHSNYHSVPPQQLDAMVRALENFRLMKRTKSSLQRNGRTQDIRFTTSRIDKELNNLRKRALTSSLCLTVNTRADQSGQPKLHVDQISRRFIEVGLGMDINEFATRFEAFSVSGLCGIPTNDNDRRSLLKSHIRNAVRHGLRIVTGLQDIDMSWKHYAADVVRKHRVYLSGWPVNTFNLDGASRHVLEGIVKRIEDGTVSWKVTASDMELEEHLKTIVQVEKTRKERCDKGLKRKHAKTPPSLSPEEVISDNEQ